MVDVPVKPWLQLVAGARLEYWFLDLLTISVQGQPTPADREQVDLLPSLALNLFLTPTQNLRLAASQTLSRPQFRELSPVPYFEQIGLLTTFGNPNLDRALIRNLDARWEWYPRPGEVLSVGAFYKNFDAPIEKIIRLQAGTQALTFVNAERADNYGVELEVRKNLARLGQDAGGLSAFANTTLMTSDITPGNSGISALTRDNRPMVGQSQYVVNGGVTFTTDGGFSATGLYNVVGRRILEAGTGGLPDAYEEARHLIDAAVQVPLGRHLGVKLEAKNLLDSPYRLTQGDVLRQRWKLGRSFGFAFSWQP
jgi:TonB-dependent receptor